jgi:hypothetical protein
MNLLQKINNNSFNVNTNLNQIVIAILEVIYVIYMLNFYVAPIDINPYNWNWKNKTFHHSNTLGTSLVCPFGNLSSYLLAGFIIIRLILLGIFKNNKNVIYSLKFISIIVLLFSVVLSFMNLNVVMYLIPYFIIEYYVIIRFIN